MTDGRSQLTAGNESLFRQVSPSFLVNGVPISSIFNPTKKDQLMLSLDRGAKTTAEAAHNAFTKAGFKSEIVMEVKLSDFDQVGEPDQEEGPTYLPACPVYEDPNPPSNPSNHAHAEADFNGQSNGQRRHRAKLLLDRAQVVHPVEDDISAP